MALCPAQPALRVSRTRPQGALLAGSGTPFAPTAWPPTPFKDQQGGAYVELLWLLGGALSRGFRTESLASPDPADRGLFILWLQSPAGGDAAALADPRFPSCEIGWRCLSRGPLTLTSVAD